MSNPNPTRSKVKRLPLSVHKAAASLAALEGAVAAGTSSPEVQGSPLAKQALADMQTATETLADSLTNKTNAANTLRAATKAATGDFAAAQTAARNYQGAVATIAHGDAAVITKAGCLARAPRAPVAALGVVKDVTANPGKAVKESIVTWPRVPGATSYAIQVNFTPQDPTAAYTAIGSGSRRRRVITAPTQGQQLLVQVAALASDGTQSAWCEPILATAR